MAQAAYSTPSPSVQASKVVLLEMRDRWRYYWMGGVRYVSMPSCDGKGVHAVRADGRGCDCLAYQRGYRTCSHMLAAKEAAHRDALAAFLASPPAVEPMPVPKPRKSYADLHRACTVDGCDEDAGRSGYCLEHARCWTCRQPSVPGLDHPACDAHRLYEVF